ncbi:C40 family peptidase [Romboutsia ilealis]|uniref:C40 family peptidase n=1 Tax=Romboutsia ilealis TaxID=1115758 RepID=UPI0025A590F0|nr:C40 family peptidase [Romboutsia ilealis]
MLNRKIAIGVSVPAMALALSATVSFANSNEGTVTADALNVRSGPSTSYSITTKIYKGNKVEILETSNGWHKIKTSNGTIGWVSGSYISVSSGSTSQTSYKATVNATSLNVRSGAGTSYSVITKLSKGTVVDVIESASNGWKKIKTSSGTTGWVSGDYLTKGVVENSTSSTNKVQAVLDLAEKQLGKPYVWGAEGPNSFDCSGLIYYVYKNAAGITLPRTSAAQYSAGVAVSKSNLKAGDLIFSSTDGTGNITHVAIYAGNGKMIHAPRSGKNVEKVDMNTNYWNKAYVGARRVL